MLAYGPNRAHRVGKCSFSTLVSTNMYSAHGAQCVTLGAVFTISIIGKPEESFFGKNGEDYGLINQGGLSRKHIFDSVDASLRRLQLDYIDLYQ